MNENTYWEECISEAAESCDAVLSQEQIKSIANNVRISHENYGMAFYSPPPVDRIDAAEREHKKALESLRTELDAQRRVAEQVLKRALRLPYYANIGINKDGRVFEYGGRVTELLF